MRLIKLFFSLICIIFTEQTVFADNYTQQVRLIGKNLSVAIFEESVATTTATLITPIAGKTLYIYAIHYFSNDTVNKGLVKFYFDSGATIKAYPQFYIGAAPSAVGWNIENGWLNKHMSGGLYVTTPGGCGIYVLYEQK